MRMTELLKRYPELDVCRDDMEKALELMFDTYSSDGKIMVCGNGGSCADSEHIVGELMKSFVLRREPTESDKEKFGKAFPEDAQYFISKLQRGIPAISLPSQSGVLSAYINDVSADMMYAQLVYAYAKKNDLLIGISTSGNSKNIVNAVKVAKSLGIKTLAFTGQGGGLLSELCDCTIKVPESKTYKIQELHLPVYHWLCLELEKKAFEK